MAGPSKIEIKHLAKLNKLKGNFYKATSNSVMEGFEFFGSEEFQNRHSGQQLNFKNFLKSNGLFNLLRLIGILGKYLPSIKVAIRRSYTDLDFYVKELCETAKIKKLSQLNTSYPNADIWKELEDYAWEKWKVRIGFTEMPEDLIFKGKAVLFKHVLVCIQEMDKEKINLAPDLAAGQEVQRVYNSLGIAINDIAFWLRRRYNIKCQANHPLGGLVNTPPLAGKAGMGWQGMDGLLITPEFGKRNRIAPIFIDDKYFEYTDNRECEWIESFCSSCRKCQKNCPANAIFPKRKISNNSLAGITVKTCIDREKCFPQFMKTLGCSICIKSCPFSKGEEVYYKLKKAYERKLHAA